MSEIIKKRKRGGVHELQSNWKDERYSEVKNSNLFCNNKSRNSLTKDQVVTRHKNSVINCFKSHGVEFESTEFLSYSIGNVPFAYVTPKKMVSGQASERRQVIKYIYQYLLERPSQDKWDDLNVVNNIIFMLNIPTIR